MIDIHKAMQEKQLKSKMLLQVHDELVFDAHKDEVEELTALVKDLMQNAIKMDVPILVEAGTGENWLQAH
jgi:DNA polymerase-1